MYPLYDLSDLFLKRMIHKSIDPRHGANQPSVEGGDGVKTGLVFWRPLFP